MEGGEGSSKTKYDDIVLRVNGWNQKNHTKETQTRVTNTACFLIRGP